MPTTIQFTSGNHMNNFIFERLSTLCDSIFQQAIDEAIEQHPEDIMPLAEKLQQREQGQLT